jgi:glyoxylate reductase
MRLKQMKKILVTHHMPGTGIASLAKAGFDVVVSRKDSYTERSLAALVEKERPDALVTFLTDPVTDKVLGASGSLKIVSNYAVGYDNVDVEAAKMRGIAVANAPVDGYSVAEFTASLAVTLSRRIAEAHAFAAKGKYKGWDANLFVGSILRGKTLALIGAGRIGAEAARILCRGFGMKAVYSDAMPNEELERDLGAARLDVDEALRAGDVVSLHVPLLDSTRHLIDARRISLMKPTAFLINTSRGPVIDEGALVQALKQEKIAGAALDVFEREPKISRPLRSMPNVVLTPHIASATQECREEMSAIACGNVIDFFAGIRPRGIVYMP